MEEKKFELKDDSRVQEMADCIVWAINSFKNKMIVDENFKPDTWHAWFKRALTEAGFELKDVDGK